MIDVDTYYYAKRHNGLNEESADPEWRGLLTAEELVTLNTPARVLKVCRKWTFDLVEFFQKAYGLEVSIRVIRFIRTIRAIRRMVWGKSETIMMTLIILIALSLSLYMKISSI